MSYQFERHVWTVLTWRCWPWCCSQLHHGTATNQSWTYNTLQTAPVWLSLPVFLCSAWSSQYFTLDWWLSVTVWVPRVLLGVAWRHGRHQDSPGQPRTLAGGNRKNTDSAGQFWKPRAGLEVSAVTTNISVLRDWPDSLWTDNRSVSTSHRQQSCQHQ